MALENLEEMLRKRSKQPCVEVLSLRCGTSAGRQKSLCPSLALVSCLLDIIFLSLLLVVPEAFWNRHQRDYHKAISTPLKVITAFFTIVATISGFGVRQILVEILSLQCIT